MKPLTSSRSRQPAAIGVLLVFAIGRPALAQREIDTRAVTAVTVVTATDLERLPTCGRVLADLVVPPTPALDMTNGELPIERPAQPVRGASLLDGITLRFGDGPAQPAGAPFCVESLDVLKQPLTFLRDELPIGTIRLTPTSRPARPFAAPADAASPYLMSPVLLPGEVQVIRGPFSGPSVVEVNGVEGVVLAQTPRALYWMLPPNAPAGPVTVTMRNGDNGAAFSEFALGISMSADQLHLLRGQSTGLRVTVYGPDQMPASAWTAGEVSETVDLAKVRQMFGDFKAPRPGEPGVLFFRVDNVSRGTVSMSPSKDQSYATRLTRTDFASGPYTYAGRLQSKNTGTFSINALVVGFFAPIAGRPLAGTTAEGSVQGNR
ncbi:MAG: hypothetical protein IT184_04045 [Acidobacteria bacterium]|nr:hypothetical protein [Acidobacteriota bacterium]